MPIHLFAYIHRIRSFSQIVNMRFTQLSFFRHSVQKQYIKFVSFYQKIFFIFENCLCLKNSCMVLNVTFFASPYTGQVPPSLPEEIQGDFVKINKKTRILPGRSPAIRGQAALYRVEPRGITLEVVI